MCTGDLGECRGVGGEWISGRDVSQQISLPCQLPFYFLGMLAWKVAYSNHVIMGCLANDCKCEWVTKHSNCNNVTTKC